jgi:hypothetical protein
MGHHLVEAYKANKAQYDQDYFLGALNWSVQGNPHLIGLRENPWYTGLMATVKNPDPFNAIIESLGEMSLEDLQWLMVEMPIGWHYSKVMDHFDHRPGIDTALALARGNMGSCPQGTKPVLDEIKAGVENDFDAMFEKIALKPALEEMVALEHARQNPSEFLEVILPDKKESQTCPSSTTP